MRALKSTAIGLIAAIFAFTFGWPPATNPLWAQTASSNPLLAPVPPPAGPAQLPAPVTTAIAPVLIAVPTLAIATPTPAVRAFNCSCSGRGFPTNWMGQVTAPSYFAARQSAVGACVAYNTNRETAPAAETERSSVASTVPILPQANVPGAAAQLGATLPGTLNFSTSAQLQRCANCVCD
ncbi:MAG: hypothetical protein HY269_09855 [Deltaproteobacteria bacterium]|nr:hypothetical protein [Deltaproteobacteria bacterium]